MTAQSASLVIGAVPVGASIIYACIRLGLVAGRMDTRMSTVTEKVTDLAALMEHREERVEQRLDEHGRLLSVHTGRLIRVETHLGLDGRRAEDQS